jgi:hypothetical protein
MALSISQLRGVFKTAYMKVYSESIPAPSFLRSFFKKQIYNSLTVQLEVERGTETIAADIVRGARGERNTFSVGTAKEFLPPYYKLYFDATQLDHYDNVIGQNATGRAITQAGLLGKSAAKKTVELRKKIERRIELQAGQVFDTGVVTLENGDDVDFKRKAGSLVDLVGSGGYWTVAATDIESQLIAGMEFIRKQGKNGTPEANLVMSGASWIDVKKSDYFKNTANFQQVSLIDIKMPQTSAFGAGYHGVITAGAYKIHVWTYDEVYEEPVGTFKRYMPANKAVLIPVKGTQFETAYTAVPSVMKANGREFIGQVSGDYILYDNVDKNNMAHYFYVMSAPINIPISVDMIYTMQVSA